MWVSKGRGLLGTRGAGRSFWPLRVFSKMLRGVQVKKSQRGTPMPLTALSTAAIQRSRLKLNA